MVNLPCHLLHRTKGNVLLNPLLTQLLHQLLLSLQVSKELTGVVLSFSPLPASVGARGIPIEEGGSVRKYELSLHSCDLRDIPAF